MSNSVTRALVRILHDLTRLTKRGAEGVTEVDGRVVRILEGDVGAKVHADSTGGREVEQAGALPPPDRAELTRAGQQLDVELRRRFGENGPTDEELYEFISNRRLSRLEQYAIIDRRIDKTAASLGRDNAEVRAQMRRELKDALAGKPIAIRVRDDKLMAILKEGRIRGVRNPDGNRAHLEAEWFGPHVHDNPPVYGYVAVDGVRPSQSGMIDALSELNYGDNQIYLKPEVRSRTTVTFGDSLVERDWSIPSPLDNPSEYSYGAGVHGIELIDRDYRGANFRANHFIEAQMFDITTADIDFVGLHQPPGAELRQALDQSGTEWRVLTNKALAEEGSAVERAAAIERTSQDLEYLRDVHPVVRPHAEPLETELSADLRALKDSTAGDRPGTESA
ncbi:hypothetical protein [Nocardia otitidiscaviarum]|uniref:hypothetical protein n=1 Tax=Nocardia otitidiscaviarum TaxID=1823 RepID=UPI001892DDC0|nr:hypothetical protein [Nocardia otitidiscaviarum]MBF6182097.1 hypothetical protein [Nocardia otitidiscaviarum]